MDIKQSIKRAGVNSSQEWYPNEVSSQPVAGAGIFQMSSFLVGHWLSSSLT